MIVLKKLWCLVLSLIMIVGITSPIAVYARTNLYQTHANLIQEGDYSCADISAQSISVDKNTLSEAENTIYQNLMKCESYINIAKYQIPTSEFNIIYSNVINNHPELFYVSSNVGYSYIENPFPQASSIYPVYTMSQNEIASAKIDFDNELNRIISKTDDTMTDLQKALTVHDYICSLAIYPNIDNKNDKDIYHSAYGFVKDRKIVCAGYALIYSAVMNKLNIPCRYVISDKMSHAWNAICIDNKWYNVDLTWDDTSYCSTNENDMSKFSHTNFLKSQSDFETNRGHYDIKYPDGIECTDTTYDNAFWNDYISNIYTYKGDYYYIDLDKDNFLINIVKRDLNGNTTIINKNNYLCVYAKYSNGTFSPYGYMVKIDDIFYFTASDNTSSHLYCYDLLTNKEYKFKDFSFQNAVLGEIDGTLYYTLTNDNRNYKCLDRLEMFDNLYHATPTNQEYSPYIDTNRDGIINAKDYASIYFSQKNKQIIN